MFSCDYNGWADVREEEREAIEAFEAGVAPAHPAPQSIVRVPTLPPAADRHRKAA